MTNGAVVRRARIAGERAPAFDAASQSSPGGEWTPGKELVGGVIGGDQCLPGRRPRWTYCITVIRASIIQPAHGFAGVLQQLFLFPPDADAGDDGEDDIFGGHASGQAAFSRIS